MVAVFMENLEFFNFHHCHPTIHIFILFTNSISNDTNIAPYMGTKRKKVNNTQNVYFIPKYHFASHLQQLGIKITTINSFVFINDQSVKLIRFHLSKWNWTVS